MSWSPAMNDGFALAALIRGGDETLGEVLSSACQEAAIARLAEARSGRVDAAALSGAFGRTPSEAQLRDGSPRVRAALAPHAPAALKVPLAGVLHDLPMPRRGYRPPAGLVETLLAWRGDAGGRQAEIKELAEWAQEEKQWHA